MILNIRKSINKIKVDVTNFRLGTRAFVEQPFSYD